MVDSDLHRYHIPRADHHLLSGKECTVKFLNFGMPEIFAVIYLKFKQRGSNLRVFCQNGANGIANSEDPDQTAPHLIWVCTLCPDLSVRKLRVIMVPVKVLRFPTPLNLILSLLNTLKLEPTIE